MPPSLAAKMAAATFVAVQLHRSDQGCVSEKKAAGVSRLRQIANAQISR